MLIVHRRLKWIGLHYHQIYLTIFDLFIRYVVFMIRIKLPILLVQQWFHTNKIENFAEFLVITFLSHGESFF